MRTTLVLGRFAGRSVSSGTHPPSLSQPIGRAGNKTPAHHTTQNSTSHLGLQPRYSSGIPQMPSALHEKRGRGGTARGWAHLRAEGGGRGSVRLVSGRWPRYRRRRRRRLLLHRATPRWSVRIGTAPVSTHSRRVLHEKRWSFHEGRWPPWSTGCWVWWEGGCLHLA